MFVKCLTICLENVLGWGGGGWTQGDRRRLFEYFWGERMVARTRVVEVEAWRSS